jgi:predicted phage terminase large subunit-like protein
MELTADTIHGFTTAFLMAKFDNPVPTPDFHPMLWEMMCSEANKVAVAAPRGHAKSTAVTHSYVLANICFKQSKHVLIVSDTESQAVDFLRDIKEEFIENELLRSTFGIDKIWKDRETEFIAQFNDGSRFRIVAKGSEQKMRGIKWRNTRPDLIIGDDLENDEIVMNEERRRKFKAWFLNALLPCGSKTAKYRIVGTILHLDSLLENLMPPFKHAATTSEELVDWFDEDKAKIMAKGAGERYRPRTWRSYRFRAHNEDFSRILWPEQFSRERLEAIRQDYVEQGFPEGYSQEYLNYPIDESNALFRKKDFVQFEDSPGKETYYVAADLAISEKDQRAFTVFAVVSVDHRGMIKTRHVSRFRGDSLEIIDEMFKLNFRYQPECFFIEQENIARTLGPVINREMQERDQYFLIEKMSATQDKIKRAKPLQARMRAGMIAFDLKADWYADLLEEMCHFPRGKYMDQVDALAWIVIGLDKVHSGSTQKEYEDEMYQEEYDSSYGSVDFGANTVTGY